MANYNNRNGVASRNTSQFGGTQTDRLAFDDDKQAYRHFDVDCPQHYRFESTVDSNGCLTKVVYYNGITAEKTQIGFTGDIGGSLNNNYFLVSTPNDEIVFYIWYNVDGTGIDPAVANATGIEVLISSGDSSVIVCYATQLSMINNAEFSYLFTLQKTNSVLVVEPRTEGVVTQTGDVNTGFIFTTLVEGTEEVSGVYTFDYIDGNLSGYHKY